MKKIKHAYEIDDVEDLKSYIGTAQKIDYVDLVERSRPTNGDYSRTYKSRPMFEYLLENIPDLWIKVKDWNEEVYLAQVVIGVVNHYASDDYWNKFVKKLGEHINLYKQNQHKDMWTDAMLHCNPAIFHSFTLHNEIKRSIGEKEINDIYLNNINEFHIPFRYEVDSALRNTPKDDLMKVFKRHINNEKFYDVFYILSKSGRNDITKEEVLNIEINGSPLETYLRDKREEYTLEITGSPIKRGSHEAIDKIFCKNLMDKNHYYRLNYFQLDKVMKSLHIQNMEELLPAEPKKKKVKMK
jgi:hypothetical protein